MLRPVAVALPITATAHDNLLLLLVACRDEQSIADAGAVVGKMSG
jgi:hypothetical protein